MLSRTKIDVKLRGQSGIQSKIRKSTKCSMDNINFNSGSLGVERDLDEPSPANLQAPEPLTLIAWAQILQLMFECTE